MEYELVLSLSAVCIKKVFEVGCEGSMQELLACVVTTLGKSSMI